MSSVYFFEQSENACVCTGVGPRAWPQLPTVIFFDLKKVRIDAVISQDESEKAPPAPAFKQSDDIEKPFAQFTTIGAEMTDEIDFVDWSRVTNYLIRAKFGPSDDSVESSESASDTDSKVVATAGVLSSGRRRSVDVDRPFDRQPP